MMKRWLKGLSSKRASADGEHLPAEVPNPRKLGDLARSRSQWAEAARHYADHLQQHPDDSNIWVQFGHMLKEQGQLSEADHAYEQGARLRPADADVWLQRGHLAKLRGDHLAALGFYDRSYALDGSLDALIEIYGFGLPPTSSQPPNVCGDGQTAPRRILGIVSGFDGSAVTGWALDADHPDDDPEIEVLRDGVVIACEVALEQPEAPAPTLLMARARPFSVEIDPLVALGDVLIVRLKRTGEPLIGSPFTVAPSAEARRWLSRLNDLGPGDLAALRTRFDAAVQGQSLTILMTLKEAPIGWLSRSVESVLGQLCGNWELNLLVEPEPRQELADFLRDLKGNEPRVRVICSSRCEGSDLYDQSEGSGALYMLWMSAADVLEPEAVYRFLEAASSGADIIYCDDVETSQDIDDIRYFNTRGSFSLDSYMSHPDLGALFCLRKAVMGNDFEVGDAALHRDSAELCMLALENAVRVAHIPAFLARRRAIGTTGSYGRGAKLPELSTYVRNNVPAGSVSPTSNPGTFHVDYPDDNGQTLIIVPTKDRVDLLQPCIDSIIRTTDRANARIIIIDHESQEIETQQYLDSVRDSVEIMPYAGPFNFSLMNNEAVNRFSDDAKYLLFLNNDIEATCSGWLERLRSLAARPDVGAVGPTLLYADRRVQHAGIVLGVGGPAHHTRKFVAYEGGVRPRRPRDMIVSSTRECSAVTGACLMVKAGLFADIDGFDLDLAVDFNDVDLCLRISQCGYRVLHDGRTVLLHHESATRSKGPLMSPHKERGRFVRRWRQRLALGDPFYSPLLSAASDHALGDFTEMYNPARVRRVEPICKAADQGRPRPVWHPIEYL